MIQALGICLVAMAVISIAIFEFVIKGGVKTTMESGHVTIAKGQGYETSLSIQYRGASWIDTTLTTFKVEAGQQLQVESLSEGRLRLRLPGKYAGRTQGVKLGITLSDPLHLKDVLNEAVHRDFVLDTLPNSLSTSTVPKQRRVYGFGEQPTGYSGPGQELYGIEEYNTETDTKNIMWRRVAKSPNESLVASVREAGVRDVVRVAVVQFAEREEGLGAWIDQLCEALGQVGREVLATGPSVSIDFNSGRRREDGRSGVTFLRARDAVDLTEAVMACSVALPSRDIREVVANADLVVTGLKELEDSELAMLMARKPLLLIPERALPPRRITERAVIWSENQSLLLPMIQRIVES